VSKYKWWILVGGIVVIGAVLAAFLIEKKHKEPDPSPKPPSPPLPGTYNPYSVITGTNYEYKLTGSLVVRDSQEAEEMLAESSIRAFPQYIPKGPNNMLLTSLDFEFGQFDFKTAYL
jgi:hypothetical protein